MIGVPLPVPRTCLAKRMAKQEANLRLFRAVGEGNLSDLQTQTFGLQINSWLLNVGSLRAI